jgi:carboxyl-terminal processing protease
MGTKRIGWIFLLGILLAFFAGFQVQTFFVDNEPEPFVDVYTEITEALDRYYLYDLSDDEKEAAFIAQLESIVKSYAESNDDPYTRLSAQPVNLAPTNAESYVGIGVTIEQIIPELRVLEVVYEGPSYQKLYPNDLIVGVMQNDEKLYFDTLEANQLPTSYLAGSLGQTKTLLVVDPEGVERNVEITYEEILTPTASATTIANDIGYIKIREFSSYIKDVSEGTAKVFNDALNTLEENILLDETDTLIIDLRDNPGGALTALHNENQSSLIPGITQQLLVRDVERPLFSMINQSGIKTDYLGGLTTPKAYDIKVLVNENSASASEVLAAALNTIGGYELYGNYTFGKDVYQNTTLLTTINTMSYYLTYTEGNWVYNGDQKVGEFPLDVEVVEQSGFHAIDYLFYEEELGLDDVSLSLIEFQQFLNAYFELEGALKIREDGYFDQLTEDYLSMFQVEQSLSNTKRLDLETARLMHDLLKVYQNDLDEDVQLQTVLGLI